MKIKKSRLREIIREELEAIHEQDYEKVAIPGNVKRFMGRFVDSVKDLQLPRMKRIAILFNVIKALNIKKMILRPVASFSQSISPWRAMATQFRPYFPKLQSLFFSIYSQMSNSNPHFDFLAGT